MAVESETLTQKGHYAQTSTRSLKHLKKKKRLAELIPRIGGTQNILLPEAGLLKTRCKKVRRLWSIVHQTKASQTYIFNEKLAIAPILALRLYLLDPNFTCKNKYLIGLPENLNCLFW